MNFESLFKTTFNQFVKGIVKLILFTLLGCLLCFTIVLIPTVTGGLARGILRFVREGVEPEFNELWRFDDYVQILLLMVLGGIAIAIGLALLIVPGVVLMVWWMYALFFLVDQKMAFTEALGASKQLVSRSGFWNHLVILLITAVLNSLGGGLGGLGTVITFPFGLLLMTNAYLLSAAAAPSGQPAHRIKMD